MDDVIKLFNPNDKPFGKLSNNAYHPITIHGKKYPTVTNYIFSSMLSTPTFKEIMKNTEIRGSSKLNQELMTAIDFLIDKQKTSKSDDLLKEEKQPEYSRYDTESMKQRKKRVYEQSDEDNTIDDWLLYAKTGELRKSEKEFEDKEKYMRVVFNEVRKPFESINLVELKQKLISESEMNQMGIYQLYDKYVNEEIFNVLKVAVEKGYKARFEDPELAEKLLSTGNSPIQFESHDRFLGIGSNGKGSNLVGIMLMQIRHSIRIQKTQEERKAQEMVQYKRIYNIYLAYTILRIEMFTNKKILNEYLKLTPTQIIEIYGLENILGGVPIQDTIIDLYKRGKLNDIIMKEIVQPGTLVINVRKNGIRQLQETLLRDKKDIIFNSYLAYMIRRKQKDDLDREVNRIQKINERLKRAPESKQQIEDNVINDIIVQQKAQISGEKIEKMKARVIDLFNLGMLSGSLSDKIDSDINALNIPSDEDVMHIETVDISVIPNPNIVEDQKEVDVSSSHSYISSNSSNSSHSSHSSHPEDDHVASYLKQVFKSDSGFKDLVKKIVKIKGGNINQLDQEFRRIIGELQNTDIPFFKKMDIKTKEKMKNYKRWSEKNLKQLLNELEIERLNDKKEKEVIKPSVDGGIFIQPTGKPISIFEKIEDNDPKFISFVPEADIGMLEVEHKFYPTIQHYIITKLVASTGVKRKVDSSGVVSFVKGIGINEAYQMILSNPRLLKGTKKEDFLSIPSSARVYDDLQNETDNFLFPLYAVTALNEKFGDISMQNLLILTGNKQIKWMSPYNRYLGAGTDQQPGYNYIGKTMMHIREEIKKRKEEEQKLGKKEVVIKSKDLEEFIQKDPFVMAWVEMRIKDMCGVVYKAQQYFKIKEGMDFNMTEDEDLQRLIKFILDELYQPCSALIELSDKDETPVPDFIVRLIRKCSGMSTGTQPLKKLTISGEYIWNKEIEEKIAENARRILELDDIFWGTSRAQRSQEESREFNQYQIQEWHEFWKNLDERRYKGNLTLKEWNEEIEDFKKYQSKEYDTFWNINKSIKSTSDISKHEYEKNQIKEELRIELSRLRKIERKNDLIFREISQIYWNRIRVMLNVLVLNLKPATGSTIRDVLVKAEELNSQNTKCVRIIQNEKDNCIISALLNLLIGINKMKSVFSPTLKLDEDDVEFAGSIIMNSNLQINNINIQNESELSDIDSQQYEVGEGVFPEYLDDEEQEDDDDDYKENPYYNFKSMESRVRKAKEKAAEITKRLRSNNVEPEQKLNVDDLAIVEQQVILINSENFENVAKAIMKMVQTIKSYRMSEKVKQNRINFFATIR